MKSIGLSVDPWCNPTSMLKYWVNPQRVFTLVLVALYISWMMVMYASGMFFFPVPTKLGHVGHDHRLSLSQQITYVCPSFFLGTSLVTFPVQILVLMWIMISCHPGPGMFHY